MTKAEAFDRAWKMAIRNDSSLFDEIVHPEYESVNQGVKITKEMSKGILSTLSDSIIIGPCTTIFEDNDFACVNRYTKLIHAEIFEATLTAVTFKENQVYRQETIREEIDNDPSEGQDWNWEDYE